VSTNGSFLQLGRSTSLRIVLQPRRRSGLKKVRRAKCKRWWGAPCRVCRIRRGSGEKIRREFFPGGEVWRCAELRARGGN
jgi:hypothetical protein